MFYQQTALNKQMLHSKLNRVISLVISIIQKATEALLGTPQNAWPRKAVLNCR